MAGIKGDYQGKLKTIKCTTDAKLETVSAIEAGTNVIGNIDRVATVGHIDGLGTVEHVNRVDSLGTVKNKPYVYDYDIAGFSVAYLQGGGITTSPGYDGGAHRPLSVNAAGKLILDTLGTVERVKEIDNIGTVGRLETIGMIEGGTISEVTHVGTVGDITHLGSIGNVNRIDDLGTVDSKMYVYQTVGGIWTHLNKENMGLITSPGYDGSTYYQLKVNSARELILATLGTVERVKVVNELGTVGKSKTHIEQYGTWKQLQGTVHGAYTVPKADRLGVLYNLRANRDRDLVTAPGWTGSRRVKLLTDDDWQLKTAPARSRKGVVQTVANAGTAVALVASSTPAIGVIVKAQHENLGTIYVGDSTVDDTHGFLLRRDEFISFSCQNAGSVYIDASRNAQKVSALYINY